MTGTPDREALGTLLRHVLELLDGDVAAVYADLGLADYRPRFSPLVRVLVADGPLAIRDLAARVGVTHSAASQSVAQMSRAGLVTLSPGADARQRIVTLTDRAYALLPAIEAEWAATTTAMRQLDAELPVPLADELYAVLAALRRRPLRDRITDTGLAPDRPRSPARPDTAG
ncbi:MULTISPECIES: MarR family winged helix-turn-helix transcriptional regulator [Micromonospora]|uniref:MarR family transcriptional regulator n=1 Tax=Micromonospora sicca TaxID=2202420 RepID=A0A317D049_9ACTN|nr:MULTISPECIES: MarR family winged helix-turn-helix transcriptional regulator [unclassified Micromonospora]MBM0224808.1 winged helix-turn-helix transcriptional regulator [Micromonospora sp. ATA51]PWR07812.1 MarR family transcriptional regulator [Micromonospora sp. 4G51]